MNIKTYKILGIMIIESHYYNQMLLEVKVINEFGEVEILIYLDTPKNRERFSLIMENKEDYIINIDGFRKEREIVRDLGYCNIYYHPEVVDLLL